MGGPPAFETVYRDHVRLVWRTVRRLGVRDDDVEDVCQRVFEIVHRQLPEFRGEARLTTWLFEIMRRVVSDHRRSAYERRRGQHEPEVDVGRAPEQEQALATCEARVLLDELLAELDASKREAFVLCELEGLPVKAVAELVGAPVQTVYSRVHAAREQLERAARRIAEREGSRVTRSRLDDLLASARGDEPSAAQLASLDRKLSGLLGPPPSSGGSSGGGAGGSAAAGGGAKLALGLGVAAVAIVTAIAVVVRREQPVAHPAPDAAVAVIANTPAPVDAPLPALDVVETTPSPPVAPRLHDPPAPAASLAIEGALLERARRALVDGHAARALATCDRHARRFPRGALREERERLAIEALVKLDRRREAVVRVSAFDRAFPDSVQSERVHALLDSR